MRQTKAQLSLSNELISYEVMYELELQDGLSGCSGDGGLGNGLEVVKLEKLVAERHFEVVLVDAKSRHDGSEAEELVVGRLHVERQVHVEDDVSGLGHGLEGKGGWVVERSLDLGLPGSELLVGSVEAQLRCEAVLGDFVAALNLQKYPSSK